MSRRNQAAVRDVLPDPIYGSKVVTKLINQIMYDGKRGIAQRIVYDAFEAIKEKMNIEPLEVFNQALENVKPLLEVKSRRVGGQNYQVPVEVSKERKITLGLRWLVSYSRNRGEKTMEQRLAAEIIDAANGIGASAKKRDDTHRMAEANKAFAHFRW